MLAMCARLFVEDELSPWELRKILLEKLILARGLAVSLALLVEVQLGRLEEMRRIEKMR